MQKQSFSFSLYSLLIYVTNIMLGIYSRILFVFCLIVFWNFFWNLNGDPLHPKILGKKHFSRYLLLHEFFRVKYFHGAWLKRLSWWHEDSPMTKTCKINKRRTNHHASLHTLLFNLLLSFTPYSSVFIINFEQVSAGWNRCLKGW